MTASPLALRSPKTHWRRTSPANWPPQAHLPDRSSARTTWWARWEGQRRATSTLSSTNRVQANVVVTAVNGATVNYDTRPSESQAQLDDSLKATLEKAGSATIDSVSCESGLAGTLGATAYCNVTSGSSTTRQLVEVDEVNGLAMNYTVVPHLAKAVVEDSLLDQLQRQRGQRPEAATCAGDSTGRAECHRGLRRVRRWAPADVHPDRRRSRRGPRRLPLRAQAVVPAG